jgi:hypothetical protein
MNDTKQIKEELFSLYKGINNDIPNEKLPTARKKMIENVSTLDSITLITYIKESIPLLINHKISEAISSNSNNNDFSIELELNNKKKNNINKDYLQLENQIRKLENDNKYYLKNFLQYKIQKDVLEMKLNAYISLEDEYEELKEKVKYDGDKFLENDRKDNEIIILRSENSALKKEILKLENENKKTENTIKEHQKIINDLKKIIELLNKKIYNYEKLYNENIFKNNSLHKDKNKTISCIDFGIKHNENIFDKFETSHKMQINKNYTNIKNIKSIYPQSLNFTNQKVINFNSENNKHLNNNKTTSKINTYLLASKYNRINKYNNKRIKLPIKNEFNNIKNMRNNSITVIKIEKDKNKSLSLNKNNGERNKNENMMYKANNKIKTFNKIINSKPQLISPISSKGSRNKGKIICKYIKRDSHKNNNSHNHRTNSNNH